jgi:hypothetical protein
VSLVFLTAGALKGDAKRLVLLKVDGLPGWLVERMLSEHDPSTRKSSLPWMERVFVDRGVRLRNFYSRGVSVSVPSWSILDTGHPMVIRGNVEYDRYTLRAFDYLNFVPFYFRSAFSKAADMPGVELLDDLGIALLSDRFEPEQRHQSFQLYQRGIRWATLQRAARRPFPLTSPGELLDEWQAGFELSRSLQDEIERDLITALSDERILYLDLFTGDFDHLAHLDNSEEAQRAMVKKIDNLVGRVWSAIERSPLAPDTVFVVVSDHGVNTHPQTYSQGYNLVDLLTSPEGGAHHVVTNRHPLSEYKVRGLYPFVHRVFTGSEATPYGSASPKDYPTALLDLDGNERAAIYLRNGDLNTIHLLLLQLERGELRPAMRAAAAEACRRAIERYAARSRPRIDRLQPELAALREKIAEGNSRVRAAGEGQDKRRMKARLNSWSADERAYRDAIAAIERLLTASLEPGAAASKVAPKRLLGEPNTIHQLQNYAVSIAPGGLQLGPDATLDEDRSFQRLDYLRLLTGITVRNVVQDGVGNRPVDFIAMRVPPHAVSAALPVEDAAETAVWLTGADDRQLLILARGEPVQLKVLPLTWLREESDGRIVMKISDWRAGLPLQLFEDERFAVPASDRKQWLTQWHSEREWLRASHESRYSNAVIGLFEHFRRAGAAPPGHEFHWARRDLVEADLLVFARNHWNFNVRGFNPGGNHGGFLRASSHAVLMMAGGGRTGVNQGVIIDQPYDSLSFAPTLLGLIGRCSSGLPGPYIQEVGGIQCPPAQ